MEKIEKAFTNSKVMITFGILAALIYLFHAVPYFLNYDEPAFRFDFVPEIIITAVIVGLLIAFKKGETNIQKALMGALLFAMADMNFTNGFYNLEDYFFSEVGERFLYYGILFTVIGVLQLGIFISHILLQSDHIGSSSVIKVNQLLCILVIIVYAYDISHSFIAGSNYETYEYMIEDIGEVCVTVMIICMETKVQLYKKTRAEALANGTWTQEAKLRAKEIFKK